MTATTQLPLCPSCGARDTVRILYGYPTVDMGRAEERGEIILGGCVIGPESPDYECGTCHALLPWVADDDADERRGD
jgi:hypothetical protein